MEISDVRIKLMVDFQERLLGFCSITFDHAFVIRDLKIINGDKGPFVAMPSRKLTDRCGRCRNKNALRSSFCSNCGKELSGNRFVKSPDGRSRLYADIAHPINNECRDQIQHRVLVSYLEEVELAKRADYVCKYDDLGEFEVELGGGQEHDQWRGIHDPSELQKVLKSCRIDEAHSVNQAHQPASLVCEALIKPHSEHVTGFGEGVF